MPHDDRGVTDAAITPTHRRRLAPLVGLFFALIVPAVLTVGRPGNAPRTVSAQNIVLNEIVVWALALVVIGIILVWERRPLSSVGLVRPTARAIKTGASIALVLIVLALVGAALIQSMGVSVGDDSQGKMVAGMPYALQALVVITAGFTEELLFRGYAITRVTELTGSRWLGAIVPVLIFGGVHAPFWGIGHALVAGLSGLWLTLIFLWRKDLWTNIAAHALLDGLVFLAMDIAALRGTTDI
ncbi:MAG TPA: CPBP family intramembrane glutamic endopeptidase [Alphaproteobacteria bacterium]|jgi:membrane protease YdiL (CAAX protease family)|nr:CPBP family intramembrane glutamic endopeptidase [Alphaproteobacteria bacterium]